MISYKSTYDIVLDIQETDRPLALFDHFLASGYLLVDSFHVLLETHSVADVEGPRVVAVQAAAE